VDKRKKIEVVEQIKGFFEHVGIVIVSKNNGLTVSESNKLRRDVKGSNGSYKVIKNSLVKIAIKDSKFELLKDLMVGPTSVAYSDDPVAISKALDIFTKDSQKLEILGGVMDGSLITPAQIKKLASLPSLDELRAKLVGLIQAPAQKIVAVLQAPAMQIARVVDAYSKK
jgi:large subunit ribosomal protein L10